MLMISVSNVTMRYGSKLLFEDVSVTFTTGRRYGLTGPNGAGKSTFMKVLTGELDAQKGTVVRPKKIGVLKQNQYEFDAYRVIDTVIMGNKALWAALEERERIYEKPELTDDDGSRLGELEGIVGDEDGYEAESNAAVLLQGLDIPTGSRTSCCVTRERSSPSRTIATSSTRSAPTSPTSTTRPSSPTPAATTTWSCRRLRSAPASSPRTNSAKRRSPS
jgi:energy-coupling factor transporter ATP-binding protein EcfA2